MTYSIIQKLQLEKALRLDAEYYQLEYFIDFSKGEWKPLTEYVQCQYGLSKAMNDKKNGYPMFKMDNIDDSFLLDDDIRYSDVTDKELLLYKLNRNDVLFNRVNSEEFVGRTGIFKSNTNGVFASYLIRLKTKSSEILPDYLNIFLNSKFGSKQIKRYARRAVNQANVNAEELKSFKIFIPTNEFQQEIAKLSDLSWHNLELSRLMTTKAENLLLEELGLEDFEEKNDLFSVVNLSEALSANRIDAEHFQVKYKTLIEKFKDYDLQPLNKIVQNVEAKFNPYNFSDKEFNYVELSNIDSSLGIINGRESILGKEAPSRAKRLLKEGDVIVSSVEGSLEKVALVAKEQEGYLASTGFFQFRSKDILPEVLLILAKSILLQWQLKQHCAGTILTAVPKESLNKMYITVPPKEAQQKIADLVRQSHIARKKSKELLAEAKRKVEEMIEKR